MVCIKDILGLKPKFESRFIPDYADLVQARRLLKESGYTVGLVKGVFDLLHIGHGDYLDLAAEHCDVLIVGVDSDAKCKVRKEPGRPVVPELERLQLLAKLRSVGILTLTEPDHPKFHLIKEVQPDALIVSERTNHSEVELEELRKYCGKIVVLPPQAETSTTGRIRHLEITGGSKLVESVMLEVPQLSESLTAAVATVLREDVPGILKRALEHVQNGTMPVSKGGSE